jgi:hypothetical protein
MLPSFKEICEATNTTILETYNSDQKDDTMSENNQNDMEESGGTPRNVEDGQPIPSSPSAPTEQKVDHHGVAKELFLMFLGPLFTTLLDEMNDMRAKRVIARKEPKGTKGRHTTKDQELGTQKGYHEHYTNSFNTPWKKKDLLAWLACFFLISTLNTHEIHECWKLQTDTECGYGQWFKKRMSEYQYSEMFRCINPDIEKWVDLFNIQAKNGKVCTETICIDETMAAYRGRYNSHFMFIQRKPHPYGLKFESVCDGDRYYFRLILHRRTIDDLEKPAMIKERRPTWD